MHFTVSNNKIGRNNLGFIKYLPTTYILKGVKLSSAPSAHVLPVFLASKYPKIPGIEASKYPKITGLVHCQFLVSIGAPVYPTYTYIRTISSLTSASSHYQIISVF